MRKCRRGDLVKEEEREEEEESLYNKLTNE